MNTDSCRTHAITAAASGHTREHAELAALYALGVLGGDELARFERVLVHCGRCPGVVAGDRLVVARLAAAAAEREASPGFKGRLLGRAERELSVMPAAGQAARPTMMPARIPSREPRTACRAATGARACWRWRTCAGS